MMKNEYYIPYQYPITATTKIQGDTTYTTTLTNTHTHKTIATEFFKVETKVRIYNIKHMNFLFDTKLTNVPGFVFTLIDVFIRTSEPAMVHLVIIEVSVLNAKCKPRHVQPHTRI